MSNFQFASFALLFSQLGVFWCSMCSTVLKLSTMAHNFHTLQAHATNPFLEMRSTCSVHFRSFFLTFNVSKHSNETFATFFCITFVLPLLGCSNPTRGIEIECPEFKQKCQSYQGQSIMGFKTDDAIWEMGVEVVMGDGLVYVTEHILRHAFKFCHVYKIK